MLSKPEINSSLRKMMDTTDYGYIKTMPLSTYQHMAMHFLDINDTLALKNTSRGFYKNVTQQFDKYIVLILDNSSSMHIHCRNGHSRLIIMTRLIHEFTSTWAPNTRILLLFVDPTHASRYHNKVVDIQFLRTVICPWLHEFEDLGNRTNLCSSLLDMQHIGPKRVSHIVSDFAKNLTVSR